MELHEFLGYLKKVKKQRDGYIACCPAHEDHSPSLSISNGDNGGIVVKCHAECAFEEIVSALGLTPQDLAPNEKPSPTKTMTKTYDYHDGSGNIIFQVVRYVPKTFRQRRPGENGEWVWNMQGIQRVPYRLPELIAAVSEKKTVYVVEGEEDADFLRQWGLAATTNAGGAGKWDSKYSAMLKGAKVAIIPDNDRAGYEHADAVAKSLSGKAVSIKIIELPGVGEKQDVRDWAQQDGTKVWLEELTRETEQWKPSQKVVCATANGKDEKRSFVPFVIQSLTVPELLERDIDKPVSYWGDGLCEEKNLVVFYGSPGLGKTQLMIEMGLKVGGGTDFLGMPTTGTRIALLSLELPLYHLKQRLLAHTNGNGAPDSFLVAARPDVRGAMVIEEAHCYNETRRWILDEGINLVIMDALSRIHQSDENHAKEFGRVLVAIENLREETGAAIILVHHERKPSGMMKGDDDLACLRGTGRLLSDPTTLIRLKKKQELFMIRFTKTNLGPTPQDIYLSRTGWGGFETTEKPSSAAQVKADRIEKVAQLIREKGNVTTADIMQEFGVAERTARKYLLDAEASSDHMGTGAQWGFFD